MTTPAAPRPEIRWVWCLGGLVVSLGTLAATIWIFLFSQRARFIDQAAFLGSVYWRDQLEPYSRLVLGLVSAPFLVLVTLAAVAVALARRAYGDAARAVVVVLGANLTTQLLKAILERPIDALPDAAYGNSLPSGHTTVAASVAAALLLVAGRRWRGAVALAGAAYAGATGIATLALGWHRPSDAVAAYAVAGAWAMLVLIPNRQRLVEGGGAGSGRRDPLRLVAAWGLGLVAVVFVAIGAASMASALATAGGDFTSASALLAPAQLRRAFAGACAGTAGAAAAFAWLQLLARR